MSYECKCAKNLHIEWNRWIPFFEEATILVLPGGEQIEKTVTYGSLLGVKLYARFNLSGFSLIPEIRQNSYGFPGAHVDLAPSTEFEKALDTLCRKLGCINPMKEYFACLRIELNELCHATSMIPYKKAATEEKIRSLRDEGSRHGFYIRSNNPVLNSGYNDLEEDNVIGIYESYGREK